VILVITEDSLYYSAPNGDVWHNHVARDFVPNQNGQVVSIAPGDSVTVTQNFTIQSSWDEDQCVIISAIQDDNYINQRKEIWQGAMKPVMELVAVEEHEDDITATHQITAAPNPCVEGTAFSFMLPSGQEYSLTIYEISGRAVRTLSGVATGTKDRVQWNLKDDNGYDVSSGVYIYDFSHGDEHSTGTIVIR
jgi:hypothetical protein